MSETKHIPETWTAPDAKRNNWGPYDGEMDLHAAIYVARETRDDGDRICVVSHSDLDVLAARVRLLAAAPDLLLACEAMVLEPGHRRTSVAFRLAQAAIAKTKGSEQ